MQRKIKYAKDGQISQRQSFMIIAPVIFYKASPKQKQIPLLIK